MANRTSISVDFLDDDPGGPARDPVLVRSLRADDLARIVRIDRKITGENRSDYYEMKLKEALDDSGVRVSLIAEIDGSIVGFIMARVDFGEFGRPDPVAVIDTIDVDPDFAGKGVGSALLSQLLTNLSGLMVETARTDVDWDNLGLLAFLEGCGFAPSQRLVFTRKLD